jgi:hypothetical protein
METVHFCPETFRLIRSGNPSERAIAWELDGHSNLLKSLKIVDHS